jgi:hypothetical protein
MYSTIRFGTASKAAPQGKIIQNIILSCNEKQSNRCIICGGAALARQISKVAFSFFCSNVLIQGPADSGPRK